MCTVNFVRNAIVLVSVSMANDTKKFFICIKSFSSHLFRCSLFHPRILITLLGDEEIEDDFALLFCTLHVGLFYHFVNEDVAILSLFTLKLLSTQYFRIWKILQSGRRR